MRYYLIFILVFFSLTKKLYSDYDEIIWADRVLEFSSEYSSTIGSAKQILGKPSSTDKQSNLATSWLSKEKKNYKPEYIKVGFDNEQPVQAIFIYQSRNPGAIRKVTAYKNDGSEVIVYNNNINYFYQESADILNIKTDSIADLVISEISVELATNRVTGYNSIDAIGLYTGDSSPSPEYSINSSEVFAESEGVSIGDAINSEFSELAPIISPDGNKLFFTRKFHPENIGDYKLEDIWLSKKENGQFQTPEPINELNNEHSNYAIALTQDENTLLLGNVYRKDGSMGKGLSFSMKSGDKWSWPEKFEIVDFVNIATESSFYITYDGLYLFSAINDGNSYGDTDIYISEKLDDGRWSKPKNLGPNINTADKEGSPFLTADGKVLFFSSSGWPGYGSMDIYRSSKKTDFFTWTEPQNLGSGINTSEWESYFTIPLDGINGYYVSMKNPQNREDIFKVQLPERSMRQDVITIKGTVTDSKTNEPLSASIIYEDLSTGKRLGVARSNIENGEYTVVLLPEIRYGIRAESEGYIPVNRNLNLGKASKEMKDGAKVIDLELVKIEKGATITLNNIFFEFGKSDLLPESSLELKRVAEFLTENPTIKIKIVGHTDNVGTDARNNTVSKERATSVKNYLISLGVEANRLSSEGAGKSQPIADNVTEEGRSKNRRVEFVLE